jgi:Kef-type K+ transport system membrane component KefB
MKFLVLIAACLAWGFVHGQWIEPILRKRWSFYPEEILYALAYAAMLCVWDMLFDKDGLTLVVVALNIGVAAAITFILRQLAYKSIKIDGDLKVHRKGNTNGKN